MNRSNHSLISWVIEGKGNNLSSHWHYAVHRSSLTVDTSYNTGGICDYAVSQKSDSAANSKDDVVGKNHHGYITQYMINRTRSSVLSNSILFWSVPFHAIPSYSVLFYSDLFYTLLFYLKLICKSFRFSIEILQFQQEMSYELILYFPFFFFLRIILCPCTHCLTLRPPTRREQLSSWD